MLRRSGLRVDEWRYTPTHSEPVQSLFAASFATLPDEGQGASRAAVLVPSAACNAAIRRQGCEPEGLSWKTATHCVVALGNNWLLPAHHALCLAIFQISDAAKRR